VTTGRSSAPSPSADRSEDAPGSPAPLAVALSRHGFDAATLLAQVLFFDRLVAAYQTTWLATYLWVYLFFCAGIWAKQYDAGYVAGVDRFSARHPVFVALGVWIASLPVGAMAVGSMVSGAIPGLTGQNLPMAVGIPLVLVLTFLYPVVFAWALHRGRAHPVRLRPAAALALRVGSDFAIFLLTLYLLTFVYSSLDELRIKGGAVSPWMTPLVLLVVAILLWLFYLPGRIHTLFAEPEARANWISFWLTCVAAAVFAVAGVSLKL
jgi:hypothetical protein